MAGSPWSYLNLLRVTDRAQLERSAAGLLGSTAAGSLAAAAADPLGRSTAGLLAAAADLPGPSAEAAGQLGTLAAAAHVPRRLLG